MYRVPLARRNLFQDRRRAALAVLGVAVALMLVLILDGIFAGTMRQVTAYLRTLPADVIVSQQGVRTMHMSASAVSPGLVAQVRAVPGVAWAEGIRYVSAVASAGDGRQLSYVIGYDTGSGRGGPPQLVSGKAPQSGEVVLDEVAADQFGVGIGDPVDLLGRTFRISGLSSNGTSIVNTTAFISGTDFAAVRGPAVSYILAGAEPGISPTILRDRVAGALPDYTVQTRQAFAQQEGSIVRDMSADVLQIMTIIGLLIALAVIALTMFSVTLAKLREYAVAKALGAGTKRLAATVMAQAAWTVGLALVLAVSLTAVLGWAISAVSPTIEVTLEPASVLKTAGWSALIGLAGAVLPLRRVAALDPAAVFRSGS